MSADNTPDDAAKASYQKVRAGFIVQGTTLNVWCIENGTRIQNVRDAFFGRWRGPGADDLRRRVLAAARVADT